MNRPLSALALTGALSLAALPAAFAADVGVSISVSQPGVYGRVDIGRFPQPQVVVAAPVIVAAPPAVVVQPEPVYLWVPADHRRHWARHCGQYGACGVPVYFVRHDWYRTHVGPARHGTRHGPRGGPPQGRGNPHR
jgi:hypothetical protein